MVLLYSDRFEPTDRDPARVGRFSAIVPFQDRLDPSAKAEPIHRELAEDCPRAA